MCGIFACVGEDVADLAVAGLQRLQYRGYDSYGFAWVNGEKGVIHTRRSIDSLDDMPDQLPHCSAIVGHTRWATHGGVSVENCHPHSARGLKFSLVHNGIVENYQALKETITNRDYVSDTDTEVIVRLLEIALETATSRVEALRGVLNSLDGRNTIVLLFADGEMLGVREGSPLVLGKTTHQYFLGSDVLSFARYTNVCCPVAQRYIVSIKGQRIEMFDEAGQPCEIEWVLAELPEIEFGKDGYPHYMLKEIMEQWQTVSRQGMLAGADLDEFVQELRHCGNLLVTGAGGAYYACVQIAWLLRELAGFRVIAVPAYEIESIKSLYRPGDFVLAISQSGETADTLQAIETATSWGMRVASLVNMPMSTLALLSEFSFANHSGPEICVLSTKSATAQVTFGYLLAKALADQADTRVHIDQLSSALSRYLTEAFSRKLQDLAASLLPAQHLFILGRGLFYGNALTAALNIKEASYLHAEAFAAGELKHGVIALIEEGVPVILFVGNDDSYMLNVAAEVKSRGARVIGIAYDDNALFDDFISMPELSDPSLATVCGLIPCQLLAYHLGVYAGINPDKPRNLAKSVTVQ